MFILNYIKPEKATGKVSEAYSIFPPEVPVPDPLVLMSASPELIRVQSEIIRHYMGHEKLDIGLLAMIRYLVANEFDYTFCINFNEGLLKTAGGMSDADLENLRADPKNAPLEESQKEMLLFVLKVVKSPEDVSTDDIEKLHKFGWSDEHIFDASYHGASMAASSILYKAFNK